VFNIVVFYGHGELLANENPDKTTVPGGCKLLLFARHKEQISVNRMREIVYDLANYGWGSCYYIIPDRIEGIEYLADNTGRRRWDPGFISRMKDAGHLRRIKDGGQPVHNYRLFPQDATTGYMESVEGLYKVVTTEDENGVPLDTLMQEHGKPGTMMLWVPCRAVENLPAKDTLLDLYGQSDRPVVLSNREGGGDVAGYIRPLHGEYFKKKSKKNN